MTNNIALYLHIPFCVKKCDYCAFYSIPNANADIKSEYFEALKRQISFFETEKTVTSVYFGGGTPPLLGIDRLCKLITLIRARFTLAKDCEITVEVNPKTVDLNGLSELRNAGANRLSVGIQSADDAILSSIGRIHRFSDAEECVRQARLAGFKNISGDLMFALPSLTSEGLAESIERIVATGVDHISAYSLQLEPGTPLFERRELLSFPDEDCEEAQYELLCRLLTQNGFKHYEVSSFCRDDFQSRHNTAYWNRTEYFGFGASAHSFFNNRRFSNIANVGRYIELSRDGLYSPTDYFESIEIGEREATEEEIMLGLRTARGASIPKSAHPAAERIASLGYGEFKNGTLRLNSRGFRVSNAIIAEIVDCL